MFLCDIAVHPELLEGESHKLSLLQTNDKKKITNSEVRQPWWPQVKCQFQALTANPSLWKLIVKESST